MEGVCAATAEFQRYGEKWTVCDVKADGKGALLVMKVGAEPAKPLYDWDGSFNEELRHIGRQHPRGHPNLVAAVPDRLRPSHRGPVRHA